MDAIMARDLTLAYSPGQAVLDQLSFSVRAGESVVIAGLSGCGKTSLCQVLCGIIPQLIPADISGEIALFGADITGKTVAELALTITLVFQDSDNQLICTTLEDELAFGLENRCCPSGEIARAIDRMLARTHLQRYRLTDPGQLSGGEKKRAALAAVTMTGPSIVVLDEPLSGLDGQGRELVGELLLDLRAEGATVLTVEHDLTAITARLADRWLVLEQGRLAAFDTPARLRESSLLQALELL